VTAARRRAAAALVSAATTGTALALLRRRPPGGAARWSRTNFRGVRVDLLAGPAAMGGAVLAAAAGGASPALLTTVAGGLGLYDDLHGGAHARGLRGHARALRRGEVTSGLVKLLGLTAASLTVATVRRGDRQVGAVLVDTVLMAGTANLVNLLDLRPGRALKCALVVALPLTLTAPPTGLAAAGLLGAEAALLPADLGERHMLGDCGANAIGALVGWCLTRQHRVVRGLAGAVVVGLTLLSERVSFSSAIERIPALAAADRWGRSQG
jgi:UDP-GlcNAc:undecaprenyl-phosphate GlcNAc-1-phosphate transferase